MCLVTQSYRTLCDPMDCSPPGSSIHGDSPGQKTGMGCHALLQGIFPTQGLDPGLPHCRQILYWLGHQESEVTQSCQTLCDPVNCSPPGSSIHGILQARVLEWVASSFSRGSSQPTDWTQVSLIAGRRFNLWAREALNYINLDLYSYVKMLRASRFYEDCSCCFFFFLKTSLFKF